MRKLTPFDVMVGLAVATLFSMGSAVAQVAPAGQTSDELGEIVVTARQRSEKLVDVPVSMQVFSAADIKNAGIERPQDFIALTPGVSQTAGSEAGEQQVSIRGINTGRDAETNFALVIDGVLQVNPNSFNQEFANIDQIEILKGPQGATYGRNAVAGAMIVTTQKPGDTLEADGKIGYGNKNTQTANLYVSGPLAEGISAGIGAFYRKNQWLFLQQLFELRRLLRLLQRDRRDAAVDFQFAEHGPKAVAEAFEVTGRPTESPFEDAVKAALERKGWEVHSQIGVSFFRIDLGIVHPDEPGRYLAGVECDGAAYHSSATARDRDRLREIVLKDLGWNIRRIWSTDWWMNPHLSLDRIHKKLNADLAEDRERKESEEVAKQAHLELKQREQDQQTAVVVEIAEEDAVEAVIPLGKRPEEEAQQRAVLPIPQELLPQLKAHVSTTDKVYAKPPTLQIDPAQMNFAANIYRVADLREIAVPAQDRFYDTDYRQTLATMAEHVIQIEGPVYREIVISRIREAHGFQRARDQIRDIVIRAIGDDFKTTEETDGRIVVWPRHLTPNFMAPWRGSGVRHHGDVPVAELAGLAAACDTGGMDEERIIRAMQDLLQVGRLRGPTRDRFEEAVKRMKSTRSN